MALPVKLNRKHVVVTAHQGDHRNHPLHSSATAAPNLHSHRGLQAVIPDQRMSQRAVVIALQCALLSHHQGHPVQAAVIPVQDARQAVMTAQLPSSVEIDLPIERPVQRHHLSGITVHDQILVVGVTDLHNQSSVMVEHLVEINRLLAQEMPGVHKVRTVTNRHSRLVHKPAATLTVDARPSQRAVSTAMNAEVLHASRLPIDREHPGHRTAGLTHNFVSDAGRKQQMPDALHGGGMEAALAMALCFARR